MQRLSGTLRSGSLKWKECPDCDFEYPLFGGDLEMPCPECFPPPMPDDIQAQSSDVMLLRMVEKCGVNMYQYQDATLDSFEGDHDKHIIPAVNDWARSFRTASGEWPQRESMYLYGAKRDGRQIGALGNGKTHVAVAILRQLLSEGLVSTVSARFVTTEGFLLEAEATFRTGEESERKLIDRYAGYMLLVIDDIGVRAEMSTHALRILDELSKAREGKATVWTSNLSLKDIASAAPELERIASRIAGSCGDGAKYVLRFAGPDRRVSRSRKT